MQSLSLKVGLLVILLFCSINSSLAQFRFSNPSFEGEPNEGDPPQGWNICNNGSTPDTQPDQFGVTTPASDGLSYVGLVCRINGTYEAIGQKLEEPLQAGACYFLSIDLARSETYFGYNEPSVLRIWAGNEACEKQKLVWVSPLITHTEWLSYPIQLYPDIDYTYITMEAYYKEGVSPYPGNVLLDKFVIDNEIKLGPLDLGEDVVLCDGEKLTLQVEAPAATITWPDGSSNTSFEVNKEGTYKVTVSNFCNSLQDEITVSYKECPDKFIIPNVFTPNGDWANQTFFIKNLFRDGWMLQIYNRWGEQIFSKANYRGDWSADNFPTGIYYYQLSKSGYNDFKGWVQVIR